MKNMFATLIVTGLSLGVFAACTHQHVPSEAPAERTTSSNFQAADSNHDGQLSYKEYLTLISAHEAEASAMTRKRRTVNQPATTMQSGLKNRFHKLDINNDNSLSHAELGVY